MERYHPRGELGPRDVVSRAILAEKKLTGQEVYLDLRHLGGVFIRERFPTIYSRCLEWGLDITSEIIPVSPAAHYLIGGVQVDLEGHTAVENLFAVGEVASTGVHGANRLASNSLLEGLVFGERVAVAAARAAAVQPGGIYSARAILKEPPLWAVKACREARPALQEIMWEHVGLIRNEAGLSEACENIERWRPLLAYRFAPAELQETQNMILIASMMAAAALARRESRGCHFREDFPDSSSPDGHCHIVFQAKNTGPEAAAGSLPEPRYLE
jgi:L-aspartate oxidase